MTDANCITKTEIATFIKRFGSGELSAQRRFVVSMMANVWNQFGEEDVEDTVDELEADYILSQFPLGTEEQLDLPPEDANTDLTTLDDEQAQRVIEWYGMGVDFGEIATLVEDAWGIGIDQSTIYRYCKEHEEEEEAEA